MTSFSLPHNALNYLKGLLGGFENANCVALSLVSRCSHDSLARVLKGKKFCWQTLLQNFSLRTFGKLPDGYLIIDDTVITKQFAKKIEQLAWVFDSKISKSVLGFQLVLLVWSNGRKTVPLALRVYQKENGKSKIDLACELLLYAKTLQIQPKFVTFDCWYAAGKLFRTIQGCRWHWVTQFRSNRTLEGIPLKEIQRNPYWMMEGKIAGGYRVLVVRHGKKYFAASNLTLSKPELLTAYRQRWAVETVFRVLHSKLGLDKCQSRKLSAQVAHFHLCLMAYAALEREHAVTHQTIYQTKRRCSFTFQYADRIVNTLFFQSA